MVITERNRYVTVSAPRPIKYNQYSISSAYNSDFCRRSLCYCYAEFAWALRSPNRDWLAKSVKFFRCNLCFGLKSIPIHIAKNGIHKPSGFWTEKKIFKYHHLTGQQASLAHFGFKNVCTVGTSLPVGDGTHPPFHPQLEEMFQLGMERRMGSTFTGHLSKSKTGGGTR